MNWHVLAASLGITLLLSGCQSSSVGIIGGADGPTDIRVSVGSNDKIEMEKEPVRLVRINGALYYDTDEDTDADGRCGTMDGSFKKGADKFEVPQNDNESNFSEANAYQTGMAKDTIEILIDDDWEIFKKLEMSEKELKYKYCCILEGKLPNASDDSEFLVLTNEKDITFDDATYILTGSDMNKMKDAYVLPIVD